MSFQDYIANECKKNPKTIVFPEGKDPKIVEAAYRLVNEKLCKKCIVIGNREDIEKAASSNKVDLSILEIVTPENDKDYNSYVDEYMELRKHKNITREFAMDQMKKTHFFAAMCVRKKRADGMVSGINSETKPFIPAFEIIKTTPGISKVSSLFFQLFPDKVLYFSDCGVNINPDEDTLAEIAISTAKTVKQFGDEPRVAMLSFSTRDSAKDPLVDKMKNATAKAKQKAKDMGLDIMIDGEIQFDAAYVPEVCAKKAPDSPFVKKGANVFIFPDINSGNICYKVTERLAGAQALGPILQGLNGAVNDLSRGAKVDDIVKVALITSIQSVK